MKTPNIKNRYLNMRWFLLQILTNDICVFVKRFGFIENKIIGVSFLLQKLV